MRYTTMRKLLALLLITLAPCVQAQDDIVLDIINAVEIDSMMKFVGELSGEVPVDLGDGPVTIVSRHKNNAGNALAEAYLAQKLTQFGYTPEIETFSATGRNVLATKVGMTHPEEIVVLCAHYDAMPSGMFAAPAADDDGSGCGALLEAARILRDVPFEYTIVFAFWDEEEQGLVGSAFYASHMAADDELIKGVINMDAIAYDGNADKKCRVHVRPIANSGTLADTVFAVMDRYDIDLDLLRTEPGATYSDHASFWNNGFSAILMIEEFGADGNPHYHTPTDLVQYFDVPYYEKLAKLSIGSFAATAVPFNTSSGLASNSARSMNSMYAYPNPTEYNATAWLDLAFGARYRVVVLNTMGQELAILHDGPLAAGKHGFQLPLERVAPGPYSVVARSSDRTVLSTRVVRTP
ncbi:MAG: M20/M25/M40 family metallo-hydrolase [Flavobacteriales bacterium]